MGLACRLYCPVPDKPLANMKILTLGKLSQNKDEAKAMIEKLGGKLTGSANKASLCISTKSEFNGLVSLANVRRVCVCGTAEVQPVIA